MASVVRWSREVQQEDRDVSAGSDSLQGWEVCARVVQVVRADMGQT